MSEREPVSEEANTRLYKILGAAVFIGGSAALVAKKMMDARGESRNIEEIQLPEEYETNEDI